MKYTKLNQRFAIIEFPATLNEMKEMSLDLPKSERAFYEFAFKSLEKEMHPGEEILFFDVADPKLTKTGFIVVGSLRLYLVSMKGGLTGGAETETINYSDIKNVDFDIAPTVATAGGMQAGILILEGKRKRTIRNISEANINQIVSLIRSKVQNPSSVQTLASSSSNNAKKESTDAKIKRLIREKHSDVWLVESASLGEKLLTGEYGAFTKDKLIIYKLLENNNLIKTGEIIWPTKQNGEVDHFAIKSLFTIGGYKFITGNYGKDVQKFLEGEKEDSFDKIARSFYQKIPGFRTKKRWKQILAVLIYFFLFTTIISACFGGESDETTDTAEEVNTSSTNSSTEEEQTIAEKQTVTTVEESEEKDEYIAAKVLSVTDGDTIKVDIDGKEETIRLILVDTPETKHPQTGVQPLGKEASAFTTEQLSGKEIEIEPGVEERDRYGRLLAYVYVDDKMFNKTLVEQGYARVAVYPPNTEYLDELETAQAAAKEKGVGIWEVENYATADGYDATVYEPEPEPEPEPTPAPEPEPAPEVVEPEPEPVEPTPVVEAFQNCTALRAVYPDGVPAGHPAYDSKHDRDKDNYACEN